MTNETYRYLGYGVTDSNGVAHLEFDEDEIEEINNLFDKE